MDTDEKCKIDKTDQIKIISTKDAENITMNTTPGIQIESNIKDENKADHHLENLNINQGVLECESTPSFSQSKVDNNLESAKSIGSKISEVNNSQSKGSEATNNTPELIKPEATDVFKIDNDLHKRSLDFSFPKTMSKSNSVSTSAYASLFTNLNQKSSDKGRFIFPATKSGGSPIVFSSSIFGTKKNKSVGAALMPNSSSSDGVFGAALKPLDSSSTITAATETVASSPVFEAAMKPLDSSSTIAATTKSVVTGAAMKPSSSIFEATASTKSDELGATIKPFNFTPYFGSTDKSVARSGQHIFGASGAKSVICDSPLAAAASSLFGAVGSTENGATKKPDSTSGSTEKWRDNPFLNKLSSIVRSTQRIGATNKPASTIVSTDEVGFTQFGASSKPSGNVWGTEKVGLTPFATTDKSPVGSTESMYTFGSAYRPIAKEQNFKRRQPIDAAAARPAKQKKQVGSSTSVDSVSTTVKRGGRQANRKRGGGRSLRSSQRRGNWRGGASVNWRGGAQGQRGGAGVYYGPGARRGTYFQSRAWRGRHWTAPGLHNLSLTDYHTEADHPWHAISTYGDPGREFTPSQHSVNRPAPIASPSLPVNTFARRDAVSGRTMKIQTGVNEAMVTDGDNYFSSISEPQKLNANLDNSNNQYVWETNKNDKNNSGIWAPQSKKVFVTKEEGLDGDNGKSNTVLNADENVKLTTPQLLLVNSFPLKRVLDADRSSDTSLPDTRPLSSLVCVCENVDSPITAYCLNCEALLCEACKLAHGNMKTTKLHEMQTTAELVETLRAGVCESVGALDAVLGAVGEVEEREVVCVERVKREQLRQLREMNTAIDAHIATAEQHRDHMKKLICDSNEELVQNATASRQTLNQHRLHLETQKGDLMEVYHTSDLSTLTQALSTFNATFTPASAAIHTSCTHITSHTQHTQSSVQIIKGMQGLINMKSVVDVKTEANKLKTDKNAADFKPQCYLVVFSEDSVLVEVGRVCVETFSPASQEIRVINSGELWCSGQHSIKIYDGDLNMQRELKFDRVLSIRGLTQTHRGDVIVSCAWNMGLHQLHSTGKYFGQIEPGDFASCASFMDKFYVIDIVNARIAIFAHDSAENQWKRTLSHIALHGDIVTSHDKVCVHRTGVYVSSFTNHCVCVYSHQGAFIQQVGDKLVDPYLCGVDATGNLLLADCRNDRLQVYCRAAKSWRQIQLPPNTYPVWAVVENDSIYITSRVGGIVRYTKM